MTQNDYIEYIKKLEEENERLKRLVSKGLAVVDDFMPNIGRCTLQNYQRLNEFMVEARE